MLTKNSLTSNNTRYCKQYTVTGTKNTQLIYKDTCITLNLAFFSDFHATKKRRYGKAEQQNIRQRY